MCNKKIENKKITNLKTYRGYQINNGKKKDFECYIKTLDQVFDQTFKMIERHNKVLNVRLDVRNPAATEKPIQRKDMTRIMENSKRRLDRAYRNSPNKIDFNYVWTAENEGNRKHPHYHLYISVNGNACQNGYAIFKAVRDAVNINLGGDYGGLVEFSKSNGQYGLMVNRNSFDYEEEIDAALYAGSYLAKVNTKEGRPKGARVSSASRIEQNPSQFVGNASPSQALQRMEADRSEQRIKSEKKFVPTTVMSYLANCEHEERSSIMAPPEPWSLDEEFFIDEEMPEGRIL